VRVASSIHTIHRPVARSRRSDAPPSPNVNLLHPSFTTSNAYPTLIETTEDPDHDDSLDASEAEPEDFEDTPSTSESDRLMITNERVTSPLTQQPSFPVVVRKTAPARSESMMTVRLQRRARLAEKLKDVFELPGIEEVWAGTLSFSC
jgi:sterol 3beta-glucosyltransferase